MKEYSVFKLRVITIDGQKYICEEICPGKYREVLTKRKIAVDDIKSVKGLSDYYSLFAIFNFTTREPLMLSREDILNKYIDINRCTQVTDYYEEESNLDALISKAVIDSDNFYKTIGELLTPNEREHIKLLVQKDCDTCTNGCCRVEQVDKPVQDCIGWQNDRIIGKYRVLKLNRKKH